MDSDRSAHERGQRRNKRGQTNSGDQPGVQGTHQKADQEARGTARCDGDQSHRPKAHHLGRGKREHCCGADGARKGDHRSRGKVDAASNDHDGGPQGEDAQQRGVASDIAQTRQRLKPVAVVGVHQARQCDRDRDRQHERPFSRTEKERWFLERIGL